jgi:hypothetical protein
MPLPFDYSKNYRMGAGALRERPALAQRIAMVAAMWSALEVIQGEILTEIVDWEPLAGAAIYTALTSNNLQRAALLARISHAHRRIGAPNQRK